MDGAVIDDLEQPGMLRGVEWAREDHGFPDLVDPGVAPRLAVGAVPGMDLPVAQAHRHALEWPALALGAEPCRHGRAGAQAGQQEVVGAGARAQTAYGFRLVREQRVTADRDPLLKAAAPGLLDEHRSFLARSLSSGGYLGRLRPGHGANIA